MRRSAGGGFTLVELMITLTVVGILAALAYPSFVEQIRKSRRADAKATLLKVAQLAERRLSEKGSYADLALGSAAGAIYKDESDDGYYTLTLDKTATSFTLKAVPKSGTTQADDKCGTFTYTDKGERNFITSATATKADCW